MSKKGKLAIITLSAIVAFYGIVGGLLSVQKDVFAKGDPYVQLRIFGEVLHHIVRDYVDEPDLEKVRVGALRGLAEGLDPYSAHLTVEQVKKYQAPKTNQSATGLALSKVSGFIYVVAVTKGSPAEKAGLKMGDFIEYLDTLATRDISLYDAEDILTGTAGTEISLKVFRRGRPYKTKVKFDVINQPALDANILESGIGYIRVTSLAEGKSEELKKQLQDLQKKGAQKIVLDLRGAVGGSMEIGAEMANLFVKSGTLAKLIGHNNVIEKVFEADASKVVFNGPVAIVMDRSTSAGGEVIAAAMLANKRAELVGERTFGAGSIQKLFELKSGSAMLVTISKYADASGTPFMRENGGFMPTVEVKATATNTEDATTPEDNEQADANRADADVPLPLEPAPAEDASLKKAIEILKSGHNTSEKHAAIEGTANPATAKVLVSQASAMAATL